MSAQLVNDMGTDRTTKTSRLLLTIDRTAFDSRFSVLCLCASQTARRYAWCSPVMDALVENTVNVRSVCYRDYKTYVLVENAGREAVKRAVAAADSAGMYSTIDVLSAYDMMAKDAGESTLTQLLLNALPGIGRGDGCLWTNLTGRFVCHHTAWKGKDSAKHPIHVVLDMAVDQQMNLQLDVRTFSRLQKGDKDNDGHRPLYRIDDSGRIRRLFEQKGTEVYIQKRYDNGKSEIPFLCLQDEMDFLTSKMGMLDRAMAQFERVYEGIASLSFAEAVVQERLRKSCTEFKRMTVNPRSEWVSRNGIRLVDMVANDYSEILRKAVAEHLEERYSVKASDTPDGAPELRIIHDRKWYEDRKEKDAHEYQAMEDTRGVQHLTLETCMFGGVVSNAINTLLDSSINNLIVKDDIAKGRISLVRWAEYGFASDVVFGIRHGGTDEEDGDEHLALMTVSPDGTFSLQDRQVDEFTEEKGSLYSAMCAYPALRMAVQYEGNITSIEDSGMFSIPENGLIQKELRDNASSMAKCKISRGDAARELFFTAVTDINSVTMEGEPGTLFNVGVIGSGMNTTIQRGSRVRIMRAIKGDDLSLRLLPMLAEGHVRNGQLTVLPFPFKYLSEYASISI